ncbi:ATP-binding protein [Ideonella sp.]|uniref:ATP-binding protein n=1 Tax=Ideonella sp. TaxID=1929293 RepID=UPI002B47DA1C|nr:ATP-binding protein [Ideonella sp.]HJV68181.1 ATP-binding protein [Ideonella sp.]
MAWRPAPLPVDEPQRQAALRDLGWFSPQADGLSDAAPVGALRALADAARRLCGCPVGLVTLLGAEQGCQVGVDGFDGDDAADGASSRLRMAPRAQLICAHAVADNAFLEVPDILLDARFAGAIRHPSSEGWRYYAAAPLRLQGHAVGTLCVAGPRPHRLDAAQRQQLGQLAHAAEALLATRHANQALAQERRRLADLARASGDWLWELDEQLRHRWLSDDAERLTGVPASALIGLPLADEPCVDAVGEPLRSGATLHGRLAQGAALARVVTRLDTPRRGCLYVSRSAVPVLDEHGALRGWRGSARDVTGQVLAARETRERDQRMHKLLAQLPGAAFQMRLQADGTQPHYLYVNEGLRGLFGGPGAGEDASVPALRRVLPQDRAAVVRAVRAAMRNLQPTRIEYRFRRGDGVVRWLETRATPECQPDGRVVFHGFTWDVTERHQAQDALRAHEALRLAHDSAERASRAKSEFLSRVSHELRTPLNAILGFAQLMGLDREQPLLGAQRHRLDGMRQAGQALLALVDDVLDLSRIEQGALTLCDEAIELAPLLRAGIDAVQPLAAARAVQIALAAPAGLCVRGDAAALEQALVNLLSNAIKYNRVGGRVAVDVEAVDDTMLAIHVQDDGEGLRPDQLAQLFQPFNRLGAERRRVGGTGLGLVIARGLARAMGGDIRAASEPGRGSRFSLLLGAAAPGDGGAASRPGSDAGTAEAAGTDGRVVLYIEDEPLNVLLMEEVFRTQPGWTLHVAHDGASGVELAARLRPDLALIDMNLPDMNGLEVLRRVRADPATADLLCVALSADAMSEQIAAARAAGFDDYWTKPIDLTHLLDNVRRVIDGHRGTG